MRSMNPLQPMTRRRFVKNTAILTGLTAASATRVLGANDRVRVGIIGFGLIGNIHTKSFMSHPDVEIVAISDTYKPRREAGVALVNDRAKPYADFRQLLDDKSIDAVVVATPDHWHALMTMMACAAGKDVYVEKPLTLFVKEGRWLLDVARRTRRVVQVGTQQRSGPHYRRARELVRGGRLGRGVSGRMQAVRHLLPGSGS